MLWAVFFTGRLEFVGGGESSPSSSSSMLDFRLRRFMVEGSGEEDSEGEAG